jgi:ribonuclease BN (tRNA processing enzyme)
MKMRYSSELFLLHEATFQDEEQASAETKKHSTVSEAVGVGSDIPASRILLTHFSQRYVSLSKVMTTGSGRDDSSAPKIPVGLAMDGCYFKI